MFAIVKTGGKQYRVAEGDVLKVEKIDADAGTELELPVLMLGGAGGDTKVGAPNVDGATVKVEVIGHGRGEKLDGYKYKAKTNYRRHYGHRQSYTEVRVKSVG